MVAIKNRTSHNSLGFSFFIYLFNTYSDDLLNYSQMLRIIVVFVNYYVAQTKLNSTSILYNENKKKKNVHIFNKPPPKKKK